MKAMLLREAMFPLEAGGWGVVDLELGWVSPVRLDSSMERSLACRRRAGVTRRARRGGNKPNQQRPHLIQPQIRRDPLPHRQAHGVSRNQVPGQQVLQLSVPNAERTDWVREEPSTGRGRRENPHQ